MRAPAEPSRLAVPASPTAWPVANRRLAASRSTAEVRRSAPQLHAHRPRAFAGYGTVQKRRGRVRGDEEPLQRTGRNGRPPLARDAGPPHPGHRRARDREPYQAAASQIVADGVAEREQQPRARPRAGQGLRLALAPLDVRGKPGAVGPGLRLAARLDPGRPGPPGVVAQVGRRQPARAHEGMPGAATRTRWYRRNGTDSSTCPGA